MSLCQDDIEVANALGANSGIYQLTMYMLPWAECQITTSCVIANALNQNPQTQESGVVRSCAIDCFSYFSSIESFTPDTMLDILERVCKLKLGLIVTKS